jgi:hypothetical protein
MDKNKNESLNEKIAKELVNEVFEKIDQVIGNYTFDNYYQVESDIDFIALRESILLRILKLK